MSAAQKQHYVPKFILRQFLADVEKEQVFVFDKKNNKTFRTSIGNIMAERRFHDFLFEDAIFTFEHKASQIENLVLPAYRKVVECRHLQLTEQERVELSFLMAFQYCRTKNSRQSIVDIEVALRRKIEAAGGSMEQVEGWEALTENTLKRNTLMSLAEDLKHYASHILQKHLFLIEAPKDTSFYLGDDPVVMHNDRDFRPYGNIGLGVAGIQIYMPLSSSLMLCAWCPSVIEDLKRECQRILADAREALLSQVLSGKIGTHEVSKQLKQISQKSDYLKEAYRSGNPLLVDKEQVTWFNAKQMGNAGRHIICAKGDFALARDFNAKHPGARRKISFG